MQFDSAVNVTIRRPLSSVQALTFAAFMTAFAKWSKEEAARQPLRVKPFVSIRGDLLDLSLAGELMQGINA